MKNINQRHYYYGAIFLFSLIVLGGATRDILKVYTDYREERLEMDILFPYGDQTQCQYKSKNINIEGKCSQIFYILGQVNDEINVQPFIAVDYAFEREREITRLVNAGARALNSVISPLLQELNRSLNETDKTELYKKLAK